MIEVGVRELKNSLSRYLRQIRNGETVLVTDRGVPVAQIIPTAVPERMRRLMAERRVTWSGSPFKPTRAKTQLQGGPALSRYISEDRL